MIHEKWFAIIAAAAFIALVTILGTQCESRSGKLSKAQAMEGVTHRAEFGVSDYTLHLDDTIIGHENILGMSQNEEMIVLIKQEDSVEYTCTLFDDEFTAVYHIPRHGNPVLAACIAHVPVEWHKTE